ncbi:LAFA_0D15588g1_1 [Lachancea sp. 'fantastica']|nr:LAFA_0D15588g1_1 [Lachancea sp. 'fantastica']
MGLRWVAKRVMAHRYHTLPLLDTNQLVLKGMPFEGTIPSRDYMEYITVRQQTGRNFFSPRKRMQGHVLPSVSPFDNVLAHCMARWLLVDYKLNAYPYFDLNILTVYTDLPQSLRFSRMILNYYEQTVPQELYQRINFFLLPLHSTNGVKVDVPDPKITVMQDGMFSYSPTFRIEDPVYIMMANDVLRHLSQDYVRRLPSLEWEQRYFDFLPDGSRSERFSREIDYWCNVTLKNLASALEASKVSETYIPTRLVQLFTLLEKCAPEHKLIAIDAAQRQKPSSMSSIFQSWFGSGARRFKAFEPNGPSDPLRSEEATSFVSDFSEVRKIYASVYDGTKICQSEELADFAGNWLDLEESEQILGDKDLALRARWMKNADIDVLYS